MSELVFEVTQDADGGFVAECLTESIFTQAYDWEELRQNVKEATSAYFFRPRGKTVVDPPPLGPRRGSGQRMKLPRDLSGKQLADHF